METTAGFRMDVAKGEDRPLVLVMGADLYY
jgi:hypothetical protein